MKTTQKILIICFLVSAFTGCDRNNPVPVIPEKKSNFQKTVFTQPNSGSTITLVSDKECEINNRGNIILAEYSRQDNKLRVVIRTGGGASVSYFDLMPDGLRAEGEIFLLPDALNRVHEQIRIAKEAEEAKARAAQIEQGRQLQMQFQREAAHRRAVVERRDSITANVRKFLAKGSVFKGIYFPHDSNNDGNSNLPFEIAITGELGIKDNIYNLGYFNDIAIAFQPNGSFHNRDVKPDTLKQILSIPAHFKWLGRSVSLAGSSWGGEIKEHDGLLIGEVEVDGAKEPAIVKVTLNFCVRDPQLGWSSSSEAGTKWNGTFFESTGRLKIMLKKQ